MGTDSFQPRPAGDLRKLGALSPVFWAFLGLIGTTFSVPRDARADSFFGAIGIGIAVGAVLGASTLPFYDQPGQNVSNIYLGAGIGAGAGVIAGIISGVAGNSHEENAFEQELDDGVRTRNIVRHVSDTGMDPVLLARVSPAVSRDSIWMPLVSLSW